MKVTSALKSLLADRVKPDATEQQIRKAAFLAMAEDDEMAKKIEATQETDGAKGGQALVTALEGLSKRLEALEGSKSNPGGLRGDAPTLPGATEKALAEGKGGDARVKRAHEQYGTTKKELYFPVEKNRGGNGVPHPFAGKRARLGSGLDASPVLDLDELSEREQAINGAYIKWCLTRGGQRVDGIPSKLRMTDHDRDLMDYAIKECKWAGVLGAGGGDNAGSEVEGSIGLKGQYLSPLMQKTLLDDSTSGGLEAAPIFFDDMLITTPVLSGEFFPKVNVVNVTRGRRIEGASMTNVTITSSTEGTAISLFNTANFIAAFDTTIFVASGAIHIGLDFLSDSPIDIASAVTRSYQEKMMAWLDDQIIGGDGTTEPEGILNASGTVTVNSTNGSGGPWTVGDEEALLFGVTKAYKGGTDPSRIGFAATETTYRRIRGIAVSTSDQRRVFGMSHEDYKLLDRFFGIGVSGNGGFTNNRQQIFANFSRYRMYRRMGMTVRTVSDGDTLVRANTICIVARSRWGGNLEDGSAAAVATDGMT